MYVKNIGNFVLAALVLRGIWMEVKQIADKEKVESLRKDFERVKLSSWRRFCMFSRMHFNRVLQSGFIVLSNPYIWRFVIQGFIRAVQGKRSLRSLEVAITYRCNARCVQCSCRQDFDGEGEKNRKLTVDEFKGAIDQAVALGAFQFSINGGEPMLEEEVVYELIRYIKKHHKRFVMLCTNGIVLDARKVAILQQCGLDGIEMGLDSAFDSKHDANRVKGGYQKIFEVIRLCKQHKIHVSLNTILTNDKLTDDDLIYTFLLAQKMGCLLQITPCCLTGAYKNRLDLLLTEETKLYFFWLLSQSANNRSDMYSSLTIVKCPAAREKIGLQPYGDVVSCPLIQIKYGNIRQKSLADIQTEMLKNPYYHINKMQGCLPAMSEKFIKEYLIDN